MMRGVRACGAWGGGKGHQREGGKEAAYQRERAIAIAVVVVEGMPCRRTVTSRADVEHSFLPLVFLKCSGPLAVRDLTAASTRTRLVAIAHHHAAVRGTAAIAGSVLALAEPHRGGREGRGKRMGRKGRGGGRPVWKGMRERRGREGRGS
jgi:hypothetical protein